MTANGFVIVVNIPYPVSCVFCSSSENILANTCVYDYDFERSFNAILGTVVLLEC